MVLGYLHLSPKLNEIESLVWLQEPHARLKIFLDNSKTGRFCKMTTKLFNPV